MVSKGIFEGGLDEPIRGGGNEDYYEESAAADWGEGLDIADVDNADISVVLDEEEDVIDGEEGGWDLEDLDLPPDLDTPKTTAPNSRLFMTPTPGMPVSHIWTQISSPPPNTPPPETSTPPCASSAARNFDTAMCLLSRQPGIKNFSPLKSSFIDIHTGSHTYLRAFSSAPVLSVAVERGWTESSSPNVRGPPALIFDFAQLDERVKLGYKATTAGKFSDALKHFISILHTIPVVVVETRREVDEIKELIVIVKEYVLGLQMELKRRELKDDPTRQQELAAYFTHCKLQVPHLRLALLNAMTVCYKAGNLNTAANFARRLLETSPNNENQTRTARQVLSAAEKNMRDVKELNYDFRNPFVVCGATYVPIYRGQKDATCPY